MKKGFKILAVGIIYGLFIGQAVAEPQGNPQAGGQPAFGQLPQFGVMHVPPQEAINACSKLADGAACSFTSPKGDTISGSCHTPPDQNILACIPAKK